MRLLFLSNLYPPHALGGLEIHCWETVAALEARGHQVQVLTSDFGGHVEAGSPVATRSLQLEANIHHYGPVESILKWRKRQRWNLLQLRQALKRSEPELACIWGMWNFSTLLCRYLENSFPGPVVYFVASLWPIESDVHQAYWRHSGKHQLAIPFKRLLGYLVRRWFEMHGYPPRLKFKNVVCVSEYVRSRLIESGRTGPSAVVINPGIDLQPFRRRSSEAVPPSNRQLGLIYVGSLLPHKGVHTALEALGLLRAGGRGLPRLTIVGGGHPSYLRELEDLVDKLVLRNQVKFTGQVDRAEVPAWLKRHDIFLFTSIGPEAMARTVMEAMAAGLPVIGSKVGGQAEMLDDGANCLIFEAGNAADLADKIDLLMRNPRLAEKLRHSAHRMILERFTLERMIDRIEEYASGLLQ